MKPQNSLIHSVPVFLSVFVSYLLLSHIWWLLLGRLLFFFNYFIFFYYLTFTVCMYIHVHVCLSCVYMVITIKLESLKERLHWESLWEKDLVTEDGGYYNGKSSDHEIWHCPNCLPRNASLFQMGANKGRRNWMWGSVKQGEVKLDTRSEHSLPWG